MRRKYIGYYLQYMYAVNTVQDTTSETQTYAYVTMFQKLNVMILVTVITVTYSSIQVGDYE